MNLKFGIITSDPHLSYFKEISEEFEDVCSVEYYLYEEFEEIPNIYEYNKNKVDAFLVTGYLISFALERAEIKFSKPVYVLDDIEYMFFKTLCELLLENPELDLSRTYVDFSSLSGLDDDISKFLSQFPSNKRPYTFPVKGVNSSNMADNVLSNHLALWEQGRIDFSFTALGNIVPKLNEAGIKSYFIHPSADYVRDMFSKAINEISISYLKDNSPAACIISFVSASEIFSLTKYKKTIMNFFEQNGFSYRILEHEDAFEIYINYKSLMTITNDTKSCSLIAFLENLIVEEIKIGWGFGSGAYNCVVNAKLAHDQSCAIPGNNSFYVDMNSNVFGPLNKEYTLNFNYEVDSAILQLSDKIGMNNINLQRIISYAKIVRTNKFNSLTISKCLSMSLKGANRILNIIEQRGYAEAIYEKLDTNKGRPSKYFILKFLTKDGKLIDDI